MVSKKKRPPPGIECSEPSIQKRSKVDGAGTSGEGGAVAQLKSGSSKKNAKPQEDLEDLHMKEEVHLDDDEHQALPTHAAVRNEDFPDWPEADLLELMRRMEGEIPAKDSLRFDSRAEKLDWSKICFGEYTGEQCKEMWLQIQKRLRRFRLLREVLEDAKVWVSKPWTHFYRSSKQNRHPHQPRRPLSTYMLFYVEKKDKVAKENPGLEMTAVSKIIADMYKKLPAKKKQKYVDMAAQQRKEYEEKLEHFYQEYPELTPRREPKAPSNDVGPRKPTTPFKLYFEDKVNHHKNDPDFNRPALLEKCKEQWRNMADKKKVVWINWALEEEGKYLEALKAQKQDDPAAISRVKTVLTKEERNLRERVAGKPEKPPNSGYSLFSRLMLVSADMKQIAPKERMAQISQLWKVLPDAQKKKYQEQVAHMLEQYKLEYATYLESLPEDKRNEELQNNAPKRRAPGLKVPISKEVVEEEEEEEAVAKKKPPKKKTKTKEEEKKSESKTLFKGEPEPPPVNAYQLFLKTFVASSSHISPEYREKEAPRYWQMLPDTDKAKYRKRLNDIKAKYIEDYEKFLKSLSQEQLKEYSLQKASLKKEESGMESSSDSDDSDDDSDSSDNQQDSGSDSSDSDSDSDSSDSSDSNDSDAEEEGGEKDNDSDTSTSNSSDSD